MDPESLEMIPPRRLARLLELSPEDLAASPGMPHPPKPWSAADGAAALRHQLQATLLPDLTAVPGIDDAWLQARGVDGRRVTFLAILTGQCANAEILECLKHWARDVRRQPESPLCEGPATVLYYAAIAAGILSAGKKITSLPEEVLREGFTWSRHEAGAEGLVNLFSAALENLGKI